MPQSQGKVLHLNHFELLPGSPKPDHRLFEVGQGYCALSPLYGEHGNVHRLWDFLKVTLGIEPEVSSSLLLHTLELLGSCWVRVQLWNSNFLVSRASFLQGFSAFSFYTLPGCQSNKCQSVIPPICIWPHIFSILDVYS